MYTIIIITLLIWVCAIVMEIKNYEGSIILLIFNSIMALIYISWIGVVLGSLISIFLIKEETATTITKYRLEQLYKCGTDSLYIEINDKDIIYKANNNLMVVEHPKVEFNYDSINYTLDVYKTDRTDAFINNFATINYSPIWRYVFHVPKQSIKRDPIN